MNNVAVLSSVDALFPNDKGKTLFDKGTCLEYRSNGGKLFVYKGKAMCEDGKLRRFRVKPSSYVCNPYHFCWEAYVKVQGRRVQGWVCKGNNHIFFNAYHGMRNSALLCQYESWCSCHTCMPQHRDFELLGHETYYEYRDTSRRDMVAGRALCLDGKVRRFQTSAYRHNASGSKLGLNEVTLQAYGKRIAGVVNVIQGILCFQVFCDRKNTRTLWDESVARGKCIAPWLTTEEMYVHKVKTF